MLRHRFHSIPWLVTVAVNLQLWSCGHDFLASAAPYLKKSASFPEYMADFELNLDTGDIATVSPVTNKAYLFRYDDIFAATNNVAGEGNASLSPSEEVNACTTPYSISYKKYQDMQDNVHNYYAIVCTQVDKLFLMDANNFSLLKEIQISGLGASSIISSRNPRDPFFFYK